MSATILPFRKRTPPSPPRTLIGEIMGRFVAGIEVLREEERREDAAATAKALAEMPEHVRQWYLHGRKD